MRLFKAYSTLSILAVASLTACFADYTQFLQQLNTVDVSIQNLRLQKSLSRYDMTKLLNAVECKDCLHAPQDMIDTYTPSFWSDFIKLPGKDFDDILWEGAMFNQQSYYYCAAYVGDQGYMRGYPGGTSPICSNNFCGARNTNKAEFVQVVLNILGKYIYKDFRMDWDSALQWLDSLGEGTYADRYLDATDKQTIRQQAQSCQQASCVLRNAQEFKTYLKYCMFNLAACNMQAVNDIGQAYWPVAELNVLQKKDIYPVASLRTDDLYTLIDPETVIQSLYKIYTIVQCRFDNDYDCDGLINQQDNCPNHYNPKQLDMDNDRKGDVCDDDIDGDGIANPIYSIDDEGRIVIGSFMNQTGVWDNCILIANPDQKDDNSNLIGNVCEQQQDIPGVAIDIEDIKVGLPMIVRMVARTQGRVNSWRWDMGDGTIYSGAEVRHIYQNPGLYIVTLTVSGSSISSTAKTTIMVGDASSRQQTSRIVTDVIGTQQPRATFSFIDQHEGDAEYISWNLPNQTGSQLVQPGKAVQRSVTQTGSFLVTMKVQKAGEVVSVAGVTIGVQDKGIALDPTSLRPTLNKPFFIQSDFFSFSAQDATSISWDMGDGTVKQTKENSLQHTYLQPGKKVIVVTVEFPDGKKIMSFVTVYVVDESLKTSHALEMIPRQLWQTGNVGLSFDVRTIGDKFAKTIAQEQLYTPNTLEQAIPSFPNNKNYTYTYRNLGVYTPTHTLYINQCLVLQSQATVVIQGVDSCLEAYRKGQLAQKYTCDQDKDAIPDVCDDDIDGDGIKNLLGVVTADNAKCDYTKTNVDPNILQKQFAGVCSLDNCPFDTNADQLDINADKIGDICQNTIPSLLEGNKNILTGNNTGIAINDTDRDGIPDVSDSCPTIAETINGVLDSDGCPEVGNQNSCSPAFLFPGMPNFPFVPETNELQQCLDKIAQGTLQSPYQCDMDSDQILDLCDDDIDGDGVLNQVGLVLYENPDCSITLDNVDKKKRNSHFLGTTGLDNCPINLNSDQKDINKNFIGDFCEYKTLLCGNNIINVGEDCANCPEDVGVCALTGGYCGDKLIQKNETCLTCWQDVGLCEQRNYCGDGKVQEGETCESCAADMGTCEDGGKLCGNGKSDPGETCQTCPADVGRCQGGPYCGNKIIDAGETCVTCPQDAGTCTTRVLCGNGVINEGEDCQSCPKDIGICPENLCGNKKIDKGETCKTCPEDVGKCDTFYCGNKQKDEGETCETCPDDMGKCISACGNGVINEGEDCFTCAQDVGECTALCEVEGTCPDPKLCGNGKKDEGETCKNCPADIGVCQSACGNGTINQGETCFSCPQDVGGCELKLCGNGKKDAGETCETCPADIGICQDLCGNGKKDAGETCLNCPTDVGQCDLLCGNDKKDPGETCENCPIDMGVCPLLCGNGKKDPGETCKNCPADIGVCPTDTLCGNGKKDAGESCSSCPADIGACDLLCPNGKKDPGETCQSCPQDMGACSTKLCGNGKKDPGETCDACPQDVGACPPEELCGNGIDDLGESCETCPEDVPACEQEKPTEETPPEIPPVLPTACNECPCQYTDFASDLIINTQVRALFWDVNKSILYDISLPEMVDL